MSEFLDQLNILLESVPLQRYLIALFVDTRLTEDDVGFQITAEPPGFDAVLGFAEKYRSSFPIEVRKQGPEFYRLALRIEESKDSVERLALWAANLQIRKA